MNSMQGLECSGWEYGYKRKMYENSYKMMEHIALKEEQGVVGGDVAFWACVLEWGRRMAEGKLAGSERSRMKDSPV